MTFTARPVFAAATQQVGLAAEEGGNLQHVDDLGRRRALRRLVDVGEQRQGELPPDLGEDLQPSTEPGSAKRLAGAAVRLVERGLEDQLQAEALGDSGEDLGRPERRLGALDHARAGDDREEAFADRDAGRELERGDRHASWLSRASIFSGRASPARF